MQIPLTLPEQTTPQPTRRDIQALSPVSPVPGVEGQAETLDPRLALQWTQPVLGGQSTDLARSVLERVTPPASAPGAAPGTATAAQAIAWSSLAQTLGPLLQRIGLSGSADGVAWPTATSPATERPPTSQPAGSAVVEALSSLRRQLAASDVFAAHHLVRHWFTPSDDRFRGNSPPAEDRPDIDTLSQWVSALSPESDAAERITRLLVQGRMHWEGELLPGIAVQLDREDAWREDPAYSGQVQRGAALRAQIDLPRSGRMTVWAYQWGTHIDLRVNIPDAPDSALETAWPSLQDRLTALNLPDLRVERTATP